MSIELRSQISGDTAILYCDGKISADEPGRLFRAQVADLLRQRHKVIVDLSRVEYIDSAGLGILVGLYSSARSAKTTIKFRNLTASVDYSRSSGVYTSSSALVA